MGDDDECRWDIPRATVKESKMVQRAKMRVGCRDIAKAGGVSYQTVLRAEKRGEFKYGDLASVSDWIQGKRREMKRRMGV